MGDFLNIFIIHFTMFPTHKKKSSPYLHYRFRDIPSKFGTNCPKICPILRSTSVFIVFAKYGGRVMFLFVFCFFNYLMLLQKVPAWFNAQQDCSRTQHIRTKFLQYFRLHFSQIFFSCGDMWKISNIFRKYFFF